MCVCVFVCVCVTERDIWRSLSWQSNSLRRPFVGSDVGLIHKGGALEVWPWTAESGTAWLVDKAVGQLQLIMYHIMPEENKAGKIYTIGCCSKPEFLFVGWTFHDLNKRLTCYLSNER